MVSNSNSDSSSKSSGTFMRSMYGRTNCGSSQQAGSNSVLSGNQFSSWPRNTGFIGNQGAFGSNVMPNEKHQHSVSESAHVLTKQQLPASDVVQQSHVNAAPISTSMHKPETASSVMQKQTLASSDRTMTSSSTSSSRSQSSSRSSESLGQGYLEISDHEQF